jgi:hypothetical protein
MKSFNALYVKCRKYASDPNNDQFFKDAINEGAKITENELDNFVVEDTRTGNTIAGLNLIPTPENYLRGKFLYVLNAPSRYDAQFIYSEDQWQRIVAFQQSVSSNYLQYAFPRVDTIELYPTPSSILPYTLQYVSEFHDMQYDDITGSIVSITNTVPTNALPYATVVGSGTNWLPYMAGMFFQMAGDRQWYKITSVTNPTTLILSKAYAGIAISGFQNTNYTIAEMPRLPEAIHIVLYYYAMKEYYAGPKKDATKANEFSGLYDKWLAWGKGTFNKRTEQGVIPSQRNLRRFNVRNPNLFPRSIG